jgi:hypothetical protein
MPVGYGSLDRSDSEGRERYNLPVYEAAKVELMINLKTAKAPDCTVSPSRQARADEAME